MRLCRLPAKESHGSASQESPTPLPDGGFISVWHFGLTQSKTRALNSPGIHAKLRPIERAAFLKGYAEKKYRNIIQGGSGAFGNAATRMETFVAKGGAQAYARVARKDAHRPRAGQRL